MEVSISGKNEFIFIPDLWGNKKAPFDKQFKIVYKKLSNRMHAGKWSSFDANGKFNYSTFEKVKSHIVRLDNAPLLRIKEGETRKLTVDDLGNESFHELYELLGLILDEIEEKENAGNIDKKK